MPQVVIFPGVGVYYQLFEPFRDEPLAPHLAGLLARHRLAGRSGSRPRQRTSTVAGMIPGAVVTSRRARPTIRCLTEDLGFEVPGLDVGMGDIEDGWLDELRRIAPASRQGQKRILAIAQPMVYRLRVGSFRGATWVDEGNGIVWLCAVHRREQDFDDDACAWFAGLHANGRLLPSQDDRLRDRAEAVIRLQRGLTAGLLQLVDDACRTGERSWRLTSAATFRAACLSWLAGGWRRYGAR